MSYVLQLLYATLGSLGFALLFNMPTRHLLPASLGGLLTWGTYLLSAHLGAGLFLANFFAAVIGQLWAEIMARTMKTPATLYYITAFIPLIPGSSLYHTMESAVGGNWTGLRSYGVQTLLVTLGIAAGITLIGGILYFIRKKPRHEPKTSR
ncbi:MAG: threonine/serine exporter family protein [Clostridia bacterium]|nr:threonine/serine exporter family protein [Clostridia bacterium]